MNRADGGWAAHRRAEVEQLAEGLARRPTLVAARLRQSFHGSEWLLSRWRSLARVLANGDAPLGDDSRRLAVDLLGLAPRAAAGPAPLDLPADGEVAGDADLAARRRGSCRPRSLKSRTSSARC